jgi:GDP-4-dehydro-6-deoxy-D-mannose reductase
MGLARVSPTPLEEPLVRVLITGVNGFAGSHLAELLSGQGDELWGVGRGGEGRIAHLRGALSYREGDLTDPAVAAGVVAEAAPERVYHLAGQAFGPASWANPWHTVETNLRSQLNVLQALAGLHSPARVLVVGSIEAFGAVSAAGLPIVEETPMRPANPYAVSKAAQDLLGLQYFLSHGLQVVRVHPANHIGPRQADLFVVSSFARQIAEIEAGRRPPVLEVGNLAAQRDFSDVRDMVRAYRLALEGGVAGEAYVIGSGRPVAISHLVELLLAASRVPIEVRPDPARMRPSDTPVSYCDPAKLRSRTGWEPTVALAQSLTDTLDYWRARIEGDT